LKIVSSVKLFAPPDFCCGGLSELKAIVVFDSRYGNTEKIASEIAKGLKESQIQEVVCSKTTEVDIEKFGDFDLIAVGGPTEMHHASPPMREFLSKLKHFDLKGKYGFAFDTKLNSWWAGDASNAIEHVLRDAGAKILMPPSSAFVTRPPSEELQPSAAPKTRETKKERHARKSEEKEIKHAAAVLEEGMEGKFELIGFELGHALVQAQTILQSS